MTTTIRFSEAQTNYMIARAAFDVAYKAHRDHDKLMDAECEKLGIETPYGILPDGHPMWEEGQRLLDEENAASTLMYKASHELFDWATETTLAKMGTPEQKAQIRDMVAKVKKMAFVEKYFIELVESSMKLAA
jgi:hypothetical protein